MIGWGQLAAPLLLLLPLYGICRLADLPVGAALIFASLLPLRAHADPHNMPERDWKASKVAPSRVRPLWRAAARTNCGDYDREPDTAEAYL
ncbi:hypothetical protein [Micromonospora avicenniae]|uniref:Uncharacterized protein n=1 Tax=Micromonospora avicenniae TaxID=1198245 RepID=A0A1N7F0W0_9ACTN|nr:hypothetical protein [Micromonospora avicenniae]SIR93947.1 hypothetical protein SAMN05444858_12934 [Micromonospora avicenniae]